MNVAGGSDRRDGGGPPLLCAVAGSYKDQVIAAGTAAFGEVGLGGEVRAVPMAESRLNEAAKMGFTRVLLPASNAERLRRNSPLRSFQSATSVRLFPDGKEMMRGPRLFRPAGPGGPFRCERESGPSPPAGGSGPAEFPGQEIELGGFLAGRRRPDPMNGRTSPQFLTRRRLRPLEDLGEKCSPSRRFPGEGKTAGRGRPNGPGRRTIPVVFGAASETPRPPPAEEGDDFGGAPSARPGEEPEVLPGKGPSVECPRRPPSPASPRDEEEPGSTRPARPRRRSRIARPDDLLRSGELHELVCRARAVTFLFCLRIEGVLPFVHPIMLSDRPRG